MNFCFTENSYPFIVLNENVFDEAAETHQEELESLSDFLIGYRFDKFKSNIVLYPLGLKGAAVQANIGDYIVITDGGAMPFSKEEFEDKFYTKEEPKKENQ